MEGLLRIAVCDDTAQDQEDTCFLLKQYAAQRSLGGMEICAFSDASALIGRLQAGERFDLYLLDVLMPGENGIDAGRAVREKDRYAAVIYLTSSPDYALEAFAVHAQRYLLKPIKPAELAEALDAARELPRPRTAGVISVKTASGVVNLAVDEIAVVENYNRTLHFYLARGAKVASSYIRQPFEACIAPLLESGCFVKCHKSFAVNLAWVQSASTAAFTMEGGQTVPISRSNAAQARKEYLRFMAHNGQP